MTSKYIQSNELQSQIDWDAIMKMSRYAGGHDEQMEGLFKGSSPVGHWNEGDYQGKVATCVQLTDGRYAIYHDYYGSCSGCDSWEDASDESVKAMCIGLADSAYIFGFLQDVLDFLTEASASEWSGFESWQPDAARGLLAAIKKNRGIA
jgi:hypothetical protein